MKIYIVLYKDGSMLPLLTKPKASSHQKGAKLFKVQNPMHTTFIALSAWYARGNEGTDKIKPTPFTKG